MAQPTKLSFIAEVNPPGSNGVITVEATHGVQAVGSITGDPADFTEPGTVAITIRDADTGVTARITLDDDYLTIFGRTLTTAGYAMNSRDVSLDEPTAKDRE
jgi:hypothetical protein